MDKSNPDHAAGLCAAQTVYSRLMAAAALLAALLPAALPALLPPVEPDQVRPDLCCRTEDWACG